MEEIAKSFVSAAPVIVFAGYSIHTLRGFRERYSFLSSWPLAYACACVCASRSGGALASFVALDNHAKWLSSDFVIPLQVLVWWLHSLVPFSDVVKRPVPRTVIGILYALYRAQSVMSSTALGARVFPGSVVGPLVMTALTSCASRWLVDFILMSVGVMEMAPDDSDWKKPSHKLKTAVWCSLVFLLAVDPGGAFHGGPLLGVSWPFVLAVVLFYQYDFYLTETVKRPISWSSPIDALLFRITGKADKAKDS